MFMYPCGGGAFVESPQRSKMPPPLRTIHRHLREFRLTLRRLFTKPADIFYQVVTTRSLI